MTLCPTEVGKMGDGLPKEERGLRRQPSSLKALPRTPSLRPLWLAPRAQPSPPAQVSWKDGAVGPLVLSPFFFFLKSSRYVNGMTGKGKLHTHSHKHNNPHMDTLSHTLSPTLLSTRLHTDTYTQSLSHTQTHTGCQVHPHMQRHCPSIHTRTRARAHTHPLTDIYSSHPVTYIHTKEYALILSQAPLSPTHGHILADTQSHTKMSPTPLPPPPHTDLPINTVSHIGS